MQSTTEFTPAFLIKKLLPAVMLFSIMIPPAAYADFTFQDTPLKEVIQSVQEETAYFFLYRESQVADIRITLEATDSRIIEELKSALAGHRIDLHVDPDRNQVLLTRRQRVDPVTRQVVIKGQIVDETTGERLPFATLSWKEDDLITGVTTNASGHFEMQRALSQTMLVLSASYVGYKKRQVRIDLTESSRIEDLTIRLEKEAISGNEIVITGFTGYHPSDTLLSGMIDAGRFSPLGESNSIRALQFHPSVSILGSAMNDGINVRGSTPDGFLVLLDGMSIFNQHHLFGLLDSFNADAIQSSGYYFGITPANIDTPTGGTLNLITRTGSRNEFRNQAGISNTSVNGTFEGPLGSRSSWLLSARTSYIDQFSWFNNQKLVQWGLGIDRPRRVASDEPDFTDLVLHPGATSARFLDLHGKIYHETSGAGRFILSGYLGGDRTSQDARRRARAPGTGGQFVFEEVQTTNIWGNALMSIKYEQEFFNSLFSSTTAGFSTYETEFDKDDFVYSRVSNLDEDNQSVTIFTYPFRNRSTMNEFKVNQNLEYRFTQVDAILGGTWRYYQGEYSESSFDRSAFFTRTNAHLLDTYLQTEWKPVRILQLDAGGRFYFYSPGNRVFAGPRLQARISPLPQLHFFGGYSVNHQFLHRVSLQNTTTADVWILSTEKQSPASSTQFSAGMEFSPLASVYLKIEAYQKQYENLRIHELNTQTLENTFSGTPWFYQNNGEARGLEVILRNRWDRITFTQSYTLSRMVFQNPYLFDGEDFFADWDRTHSYNSVIQTRLGDNFELYLSWIMMSGASNALSTFETDTETRLDAYYRMDATLTYQYQFSRSSQLEVNFSVFNLLDRDNVWYRNYDFNYDETRSIPRLQPVPVDVLDLGIQPSFSIKYSF